jgi:hypothetical protein
LPALSKVSLTPASSITRRIAERLLTIGFRSPRSKSFVLATDLDPETIKPKRAYRRNRYFARNELSRLCLGVLRTAGDELLSTDDIASRIVAAKGFDAGDAILRTAIREQVGSTVKRLHRAGTIENIGRGRATRWKLT